MRRTSFSHLLHGHLYALFRCHLRRDLEPESKQAPLRFYSLRATSLKSFATAPTCNICSQESGKWVRISHHRTLYQISPPTSISRSFSPMTAYPFLAREVEVEGAGGQSVFEESPSQQPRLIELWPSGRCICFQVHPYTHPRHLHDRNFATDAR